MIRFVGSQDQKQEESLHQQAGQSDTVAHPNRSQVSLRVRFALLAGIRRFVGVRYGPVESSHATFASSPQ